RKPNPYAVTAVHEHRGTGPAAQLRHVVERFDLVAKPAGEPNVVGMAQPETALRIGRHRGHTTEREARWHRRLREPAIDKTPERIVGAHPERSGRVSVESNRTQRDAMPEQKLVMFDLLSASGLAAPPDQPVQARDPHRSIRSDLDGSHGIGHAL